MIYYNYNYLVIIFNITVNSHIEILLIHMQTVSGDHLPPQSAGFPLSGAGETLTTNNFSRIKT